MDLDNLQSARLGIGHVLLRGTRSHQGINNTERWLSSQRPVGFQWLAEGCLGGKGVAERSTGGVVMQARISAIQILCEIFVRNLFGAF